MKKDIYQVDAFTEVTFGGNPAAVVLGAEDLSQEQMIKIAREMNLSETAFVIESKNMDYDYEVKFFTPTEEVDLCGHATIATFYLLSKLGYIKGNNTIKKVKQKTKAGILPVEITFTSENVTNIMMTQAKPQKIFTLDEKEIKELCGIMGIEREEIGLYNDKELLPMAYSTGLPDIILPVKNADILKKINPDFSKLIYFSNKKEVVGVHAFTFKDNSKNIITCRNFAPACGINEEAATGTSNGALGGYLYENRILEKKKKNELICEQGMFMNRPSKIIVNIEENLEDITVKVGGKAVIIMEGKIYL